MDQHDLYGTPSGTKRPRELYDEAADYTNAQYQQALASMTSAYEQQHGGSSYSNVVATASDPYPYQSHQQQLQQQQHLASAHPTIDTSEWFDEEELFGRAVGADEVSSGGNPHPQHYHDDEEAMLGGVDGDEDDVLPQSSDEEDEGPRRRRALPAAINGDAAVTGRRLPRGTAAATTALSRSGPIPNNIPITHSSDANPRNCNRHLEAAADRGLRVHTMLPELQAREHWLKLASVLTMNWSRYAVDWAAKMMPSTRRDLEVPSSPTHKSAMQAAVAHIMAVIYEHLLPMAQRSYQMCRYIRKSSYGISQSWSDYMKYLAELEHLIERHASTVILLHEQIGPFAGEPLVLRRCYYDVSMQFLNRINGMLVALFVAAEFPQGAIRGLEHLRLSVQDALRARVSRNKNLSNKDRRSVWDENIYDGIFLIVRQKFTPLPSRGGRGGGGGEGRPPRRDRDGCAPPPRRR